MKLNIIIFAKNVAIAKAEAVKRNIPLNICFLFIERWQLQGLREHLFLVTETAIQHPEYNKIMEIARIQQFHIIDQINFIQN